MIHGWLREQEDWPFLGKCQSERNVLLMRGSYTEQAIERPHDLVKVENQGQQGSCQGHDISSCLEYCYVIATQDITLQLSRAMGYYESQRIDGINGDSGSTISGGVKLASTVGICEEKLWPYPPRYNNRRPANYDREVVENAGKYRIANQVRITSYDGLRTFLGAGVGAVSIGVAWGSSLQSAVVESYRGGNGGHAIALPCLSTRKDQHSRPYVWMLNSWGTGFGNDGWSEWSPRACEQIFAHRYTVAIGVSDMPNIQPREFTAEDWTRVLRW